MRPVNVGNVWNTEMMHVRGTLGSGAVGHDVVLAYESTTTSFWYVMTTDQARQMAAALIAFSDIQDAKVAKAE